MLPRLKKQLYSQFVLPTSILFIVAGLVTLIFIKQNAAGFALLSAAFVLFIAGLILIPKALSPVSLVEKAVDSLEKGNEKLVIESAPLKEEPILMSLGRISEKIELQEKKLQEEKLRRLRSVIDGQDQERHRLARELHDSLGQSLIAVRLQLESAEKPGISQVRAAVDMSKGMIDQAIDEVRRISNALQPAALDEFGLETALRTKAIEMAAIAGIEATFTCNGSVERLEKKSKIYLYRIAQEAITNIIKHARATKMDVELTRIDQTVTLRISDNGKGFVIDPINFAHRNGIQNMRERASLLTGTFNIESVPKEGTRIIVTIPYKRNEGENKNPAG
jgi:signal transduction histidine kinase